MHARTSPSSSFKVLGGLLVLLGIWAALIPFVGPSIGLSSGKSWNLTEGRVTLHLIPGIVAALGGFLLASGRTGRLALGAGLAVLGGVWSVVAPTLHPLWADGGGGMMMMGSSKLSSAMSSLAYHYGVGILITLVAAFALGMLTGSRHARTDKRTEAPVEDRERSLANS